MPPIDTSPQSVVRYLTRLLSAMCMERGGELRIRRSVIREIEEDNSRHLLCEDVDSEKDELVLRFTSKNAAIYPLEPECLSPKTSPSLTSQPTSSPSSQPSPQVRAPLSEEKLRQMEESVRKARLKKRQERMEQQAREQRQNDLSEILGENS